MGLLDLLPTSDFGLAGTTPATIPSANPNSTIHNIYSITGNPAQTQNQPAPSQLDLDGTPPVISPTGQGLPYMNNLPG
jgi:hypothetical protein